MHLELGYWKTEIYAALRVLAKDTQRCLIVLLGTEKFSVPCRTTAMAFIILAELWVSFLANVQGYGPYCFINWQNYTSDYFKYGWNYGFKF